MKVKALLIPGGKTRTLELKSGAVAEDVVRLLGMNRETVVVRRAGKPIPECEPVMSGDDLEILTIISGG